MPEFGRIYFDTNILIDMVEATGEAPDLMRRMRIDHSADRPAKFVTSALTLAEVLVHPLRENRQGVAALYRRMLSGEAWLSVVGISPDILEHAAALRAARRSLKLPDAIHVATAMQAGCSHFLTQDEGIQTGEPAIHPLTDVALTPAPVIRPDAPTLAAILEDLTP